MSLSTNVKADVIPEYSLEMKINEDLSSQIDINVDLLNNSDTSIISAYTIDFPFKLTSADAYLDNNAVNVILDSSTNFSTVKIDFLKNVIHPTQSGNLSIRIFSLDSIQSIYNTKQLYLPFPSSNYEYSNVNISILYPVLFGSVSYSSEYKYAVDIIDDTYAKVSFEQNSPIHIIWGSPIFNISFDTNIQNRKDANNHYLYNLIPEYPDQEVDYLSIFKAEYGLTDRFNTSFAFVNVNSENEVNLSSEARIKNSTESKNSPTYESYNWFLNLDSVLGQKIYSQINQGTDTTAKLKSLNEYIFENFSINSKLSSTDFSKIWESNNTDLTQLEYCNLIISSAEYMGLKAIVEYGYNVFETGSDLQPLVWCRVYADGKSYIFDFSLQKSIGFPQFFTSSIDRLKMGIWHPSQSYNNILGLMQENGITSVVSEVDDRILNKELKPQLQLNFPERVFSGEFYSGIVQINNPTSKILNFNELTLNGESILTNITVGDLQKSILPLQQNSIQIDYLREKDFILDLSQEILVDAKLNDNKISSTIEVKFEPDFKLLAVFFLIFLVTVSILIYLILKLFRRKQ